jgi:hypothetical protein
MDEKIPVLMNVLWVSLILFWIISGINAKKSSFKETLFKQFVFYWLPIILAVYLLGPDERFGNSLVRGNFVAHNNTTGITGLALCLLGLVTACWSRVVSFGPCDSLLVPLFTGEKLERFCSKKE